MRHRTRLILTLLLLLLAEVAWSAGPNRVPDPGTFPWRATTTTSLNLRSGPGTGYESMGVFDEGAFVIADSRTTVGNWVKVKFNDKNRGPMEGYVDGTYLNYVSQVSPSPPQKQKSSLSFSDVLSKIWGVLKFILIVGVVLLVIAFKDVLVQIAAYIGCFMGVGALISYLIVRDGTWGAVIGLIVAVLVAVRNFLDLDHAGGFFRFIFAVLYYTVSFPFYVLNQLQYFLSEPWRIFFKYHHFSDRTNDVLRPFFEVLKVLLYVAITPLRLVNAAYYNILIHGLSEIYDFLLEVLAPSSPKEGAGNFWMWMLLLPWRLLKYPVFHGVLTILECVVWTVIDIFIPAITLYHGTDLVAGQSIAGSRNRNDQLRKELGWDSGTFRASDSSWGGIGVYFAARRVVASRYANDPYRLSDRNPVVIVCRVSLGRIINYSLAPLSVFAAAGGNGHPPTLNRYGMQHHYTTGEWWNDRGGYWEYCLFDWRNRYNHPWRIRPVYIFNYRTNLIQHIRGGMAHWLFKF